MSTTYTISSTDGDSYFIITPGSIDGAGNAGHQTDLLLYGQGTFNWGKGIEQNLIRLTENWASPALNPNDPINEQVPMVYGANDNKGIVVPIVGQTWFNKSANRIHTYVGLKADNVTGDWRVDGEFNYVSLTETADQEIAGKLRITQTAGQPDLYITSDTPEYGIGVGPIDNNTGLPTDLGASSYITFEANKGSSQTNPERVRTAYIASLHKDDNFLRIAVTDRDAANSYSGNAVLNRFDLGIAHTESNKNIKYVGPGQITGNIDEKTLTTREWVENYADDAVTTIGDGSYLKLTGGTVTGAVNQTVGANTINLNNGSIQIEASSPTVTLRSHAADAGQPSFNLADADLTKVSIKLIQGNYSGNAGPRNFDNAATTEVNEAAGIDTLVIEKYNTGFNTTQAMIFYDDYIQTHGDNGHLRTPATPMLGAANYSEFAQLTVGKAYDTFCATNTDITVKDITADNISMSNGSAAASILVHSQNTATITIDASNNLNTVNPSLIFRARGTQRGMLRVIPDTNAHDAVALFKMNGGAEPNALKIYDDYSTIDKRLVIGGQGTAPSHGSLILKAKDNNINPAVHNYGGTFIDSDYNGIVWKNASDGFVASILSDNDSKLVIRVPTNPSVSETEAPIVTLSNNRMKLANMRVQTSGSESLAPDFERILPTSSHLAHEVSLYELTNRRVQEQILDHQVLLVNHQAATPSMGYYSSRATTSDPTTGTYLGYYGNAIEFDFTDTTVSSFSQIWPAQNGRYFRCEIHYQIPYALMQNTGDGQGSGTAGIIYMQYETGPTIDVGSVSNTSVGNFTTIEIGRLHQLGGDQFGVLSGSFLCPMNPGDKIILRMSNSFGYVATAYDVYERVALDDSKFTARIV